MSKVVGTRRLLAVGATAFSMVLLLTIPAESANIISFDDNPTACGGAVLCSTNGTTGYSGTNPFDLSTIRSWFQVDTSTSMIAGQPAQPANSGDFLVVNDTGGIVSSFSLTITDTFTSSTPSVHPCTGLQTGNICDNFQANKGAAAGAGASETLSGPDFDTCTNGTAGVMSCTSSAGSAAADFGPNQVTYTWNGLDIAAGATFDIDFASWNNAAFATPSAVPEPGSATLLAIALSFFGTYGVLRHTRPRSKFQNPRSDSAAT